MSATRHRHSRVKSSTTAKDAEAPPVGHRIAQEIQRPALVRSLRQRHRSPRAQGSLAAATAADLKALLGIKPPQLLVVHVRAFPAKQNLQTPIAEAPADRRQLAQPNTDRTVVRPPAAIAHGAAIGADHLARPPLAHLVMLAEVSRGLPSGSGRHHFFEAMSFNMTLSSDRSATQLLQPGVLVLERLQPTRVRDIEPAILGLPLVERGAADPVLAAHIRRRRARLLLPQDGNDLLFLKPTAPHRPVLHRWPDSTQIWRRSRGSGHCDQLATIQVF